MIETPTAVRPPRRSPTSKREAGGRHPVMMSMLALALTASPSLTSRPASAQSVHGSTAIDRQPAQNDIVVVGDPKDPKEIASGFIRKVSPYPEGGQFSRWNDPVCPQATGLDPGLATIVENKIRREALTARVPVGKAGCHSNIVVVFTRNARSFMETLVRKRPAVISGLSLRERRHLLQSDVPVRWWHHARIEGADGEQPSLTSPAWGQNQAPRVNGVMLDSYSSSMIDSKMRMSLDSIVIIVDADATAGRTLNEISALVSMAGLARIEIGQPTDGLPSVLSMFSSDGERSVQGDLTRWDRAYLAALYSVPPNRNGGQQRTMMISAMQAYTPSSR